MIKYFSFLSFVVVELLVLAYIFSTSPSLPDIIATHFNGAGMPNGYMSHSGYQLFMLLFALVIPTIIVGALSLMLRLGKLRLNIPHRAYWLSPEQQPNTIGFLKSHMGWLGVLFALFMGFIHWLILTANTAHPVQLINSNLFMGVAAFLVGLLIWIVVLMMRFSRLPPTS